MSLYLRTIILAVHHLSRDIANQKWAEWWYSYLWLCFLLPLCTIIIQAIEKLCRFQILLYQMSLSPSPQRWWTSSIRSTDLHTPLQLQSKEAAQGLPACAFHSQSDKTAAQNVLIRQSSLMMHNYSFNSQDEKLTSKYWQCFSWWNIWNYNVTLTREVMVHLEAQVDRCCWVWC